MFEGTDAKPTPTHAKTLVDRRNQLWLMLKENGFDESEISYMFNRQIQLVTKTLEKLHHQKTITQKT